jgi:hypothetical protein
LPIPLKSLPAGFAATAAATGATASRPAATAATATRAPAATTTTAEAAPTPATTTAAAVGLGTGFVHIQCAAVQGVTVKGGNRLIRLAFILHLDESETARTSGFAICHDSGTVNLAVAFEEAANRLFGGVEIQVAYEYVLHSSLLSI